MEPKRPKKPIPELRAELLADRRTRDMAERLGMTLEDYVEKVLDFVAHPEKKPLMNLLPDAEVKAEGGATLQEVKQWFQDAIDGKFSIAGESRVRDGFDKPINKRNS